jgi:predicted DNA-binding ArsR family transcriptional regulator
MNPLNYCTLELSHKLVENGIVLETEAYWIKVSDSYKLVHSKYYLVQINFDCLPAPSFAELWRELPETFAPRNHTHYLYMRKINNFMQAGYVVIKKGIWTPLINFEATNPADALAELLIWVQKESK